MKLLKKIAIALAVLFVLYIIVACFLPSKIRVQRSLVINAPSSVIFEQVNNFHNWTKWSYWDNIDPEMQSTYEGPESGAGAVHNWTSKNKDVGNGSITIIDSKPNSFILTDLNFEGMGVSHGGWTITDTVGGTVVTTYMEMEMGLMGRVFPGLMMDSFLGGDFAKTLEGLKKLCESIKLPPPVQGKWTIEATTYPEQILASTKATTNIQTISADIGASYQKIGEFMKKNQLEMAGPVCAFYHSFSAEKIEMECAIPVAKMVKGEGDVNVNTMKAGNAVVAHYYGPYMGTEQAHAALDQWMKENKKEMVGSPWEVYVTDPMVEKDTAKWLTEIYYPVK